jgi:hypothetical protein
MRYIYMQNNVRETTAEIFARLENMTPFSRLGHMMAAYPNYRFKQIVPDPHFETVISNIDRLISFKLAFPAQANQVVERVLENPDHFFKITPTLDSLRRFGQRFPEHTPRAIEMVLKNNNQFSSLLQDRDALVAFATIFPEYADRAREMYELLNGAIIDELPEHVIHVNTAVEEIRVSLSR